MPDTYSSNTGITLMAFDDPGWDVIMNANLSLIDALSPIGALCVRTTEVPSASLNVRVSAGTYQVLNGTAGTYAGTTSQAIAASSTKVLYLDAFGALQVADSYPTAAAYVPLATVVTGTASITSITDNRACAAMIGVPYGGTLVNAADDTAAAAAGIAIGCLYRTSSAVKIRIA